MDIFGKFLGFVLATALFIVTVSCTVDLLGQILPVKYWYLPTLSTAAFDVGVIAWLLILLHSVENKEQRTIAWVMLGTDFIGVAITSVADVFFYDAAKGLLAALPSDWVRWIIVGLMVIILGNVAGWLAMHIVHPRHIQRALGRGSAARPAPRTRVSSVAPRRPKALPPAKTAVVALATTEALAEEEIDENAEAEDAYLDGQEEAYEDEEETTQIPVVGEDYEEVTAGVPLRHRAAAAWQALTAPTTPVNKLQRRR